MYKYCEAGIILWIYLVATKLHCHCILCQDVIQLFAVTGEVFTVPLLFPVRMNTYIIFLCNMEIVTIL